MPRIRFFASLATNPSRMTPPPTYFDRMILWSDSFVNRVLIVNFMVYVFLSKEQYLCWSISASIFNGGPSEGAVAGEGVMKEAAAASRDNDGDKNVRRISNYLNSFRQMSRLTVTVALGSRSGCIGIHSCVACPIETFSYSMDLITLQPDSKT